MLWCMDPTCCFTLPVTLKSEFSHFVTHHHKAFVPIINFKQFFTRTGHGEHGGICWGRHQHAPVYCVGKQSEGLCVCVCALSGTVLGTGTAPNGSLKTLGWCWALHCCVASSDKKNWKLLFILRDLAKVSRLGFFLFHRHIFLPHVSLGSP